MTTDFEKPISLPSLTIHSRLITHGQFYLAENLDNYLDCLWTAMRKRGLPRKIYVDNGPSFKAHRLQLGCVSLEINLSFAKPYRPQGKGKIERFFRTVRSQFLPELPAELTLQELNQLFEKYLDHYHTRKHGTTGQETYSAIPGKCRVPEVCPGEPAEVFPQKSCS